MEWDRKGFIGYVILGEKNRKRQNDSPISVSMDSVNRTGIILRTWQFDTFTEVRFPLQLVITYTNSSSHLS